MSDGHRAFLEGLCGPRDGDRVTVKVVQHENPDHPEGLIWIDGHPRCQKKD